MCFQVTTLFNKMIYVSITKVKNKIKKGTIKTSLPSK